MCWHDWDVKRTESRYFFIGLKLNYGINFIIALCATMAALTVTLPVSLFYDEGGFSGESLALGIAIGLLVTVGYMLLLCWSLDTIESATKLEDKICLKCHMTIFDASEERKERDVARENKKTSDEVFASRQRMWEQS